MPEVYIRTYMQYLVILLASPVEYPLTALSIVKLASRLVIHWVVNGYAAQVVQGPIGLISSDVVLQ